MTWPPPKNIDPSCSRCSLTSRSWIDSDLRSNSYSCELLPKMNSSLPDMACSWSRLRRIDISPRCSSCKCSFLRLRRFPPRRTYSRRSTVLNSPVLLSWVNRPGNSQNLRHSWSSFRRIQYCRNRSYRNRHRLSRIQDMPAWWMDSDLELEMELD